MTLEHKTTHVPEALARQAEEFRGIAGLQAMLTAMATQVQAAEDALFSVYDGYTLSATGLALDRLAALLDERRDGATDDQLRARLRARAQVRRSSGSYQQVLDTFNLLFPGNVIRYQTLGTAAFTLDVGSISAALVGVADRFLRLTRAAGIGGQAVYTTASLATTFTLSDANGVITVGGLGLDDVNSPGSGGALAGVLV